MPDIAHVPPAPLDWTAAPRFEVGYRLPSGFGDFAVSYRFLTSEGTGTVLGPDVPAAAKSRLDINIVDLDYTSREFFPFQWPYCAMRWRFGVRWADAFFDARALQPFAAAAAGTGIFETYASNNFWGVGPHMGLELARRWGSSGLAFVGRVDGATLLGRIRQNFSEVSTTLGANRQFLAGSTRQSVSQDVPMITAFLGLRWQPPSYASLGFSAGYEYEYWWNVGRNSSTSSRGELSDQGILLRAEFNF
jgi:Legionella pneumophila major outer membrane protein precursor